VIQTVLHFYTFKVLITGLVSTKLQPHLLHAELQKVDLLLGIGITSFLSGTTTDLLALAPGRNIMFPFITASR